MYWSQSLFRALWTLFPSTTHDGTPFCGRFLNVLQCVPECNTGSDRSSCCEKVFPPLGTKVFPPLGTRAPRTQTCTCSVNPSPVMWSDYPEEPRVCRIKLNCRYRWGTLYPNMFNSKFWWIWMKSPISRSQVCNLSDYNWEPRFYSF